MAPLGKATSVELDKSSNSTDGFKVFRGNVDPEWCVGDVPNGGYVLALALQACIQYQESTTHPDPIHVTGHYLQATSLGPFEVRVRTLKRGRGFTNVLADLVQQNRTRITTHMIFGSLEPQPDSFSLSPPSVYARRHPLHVHPSNAVLTRMARPWKFSHHIKWAGDPHLRAQNLPDHPSWKSVNADSIGGRGLLWGAWVKLQGEGERVTPASIAFLADIFINLPGLLPRNERNGLVPSETWFPTMTLILEFKARIPPASERHSASTIGLYATGTFMGEPQGRHDSYLEVWTAPSELGHGVETKGWREQQFCLATATQMALSLPMTVNASRAKYNSSKL
ncbi:thioesterase-like superfamily-domain-containing protein [Roridomyces roridus]|uniref:Thioesterase-like superfamily-domain-containing protein n=1 Tax=Roridomyces roridus TaxID=1738132 RepID=A0AAD7CAD8_9AGAR|nr:thioesterase-like superfamily-domain-containing protein [Roridomyces roridus]